MILAVKICFSPDLRTPPDCGDEQKHIINGVTTNLTSNPNSEDTAYLPACSRSFLKMSPLPLVTVSKANPFSLA